MSTSSDGTTAVTRGPIAAIEVGTAQTMTATGPEGRERHLILELNDEPITPVQARELAETLTRFAEAS